MIDFRDFIGAFFEFLICITAILLILVVLCIGCFYLFSLTPIYKQYDLRHKEWKTKVNNCVLDENYRPDCALILYKDKQNHNKQTDSNMSSAMTGAIVGGMVGASIGRR